MFVKPGQRQDDRDRPLAVRAPTGRFISALGEEVPDTQFWHRRMRDGDVVAAEPIPLDPVVVRVSADGVLPMPLGGEPLRLTAAEWARVPIIEPADGPAVEGFSTAEAIHDRDPAAPLLTHEEYLATEIAT